MGSQASSWSDAPTAEILLWPSRYYCILLGHMKCLSIVSLLRNTRTYIMQYYSTIKCWSLGSVVAVVVCTVAGGTTTPTPTPTAEKVSWKRTKCGVVLVEIKSGSDYGTKVLCQPSCIRYNKPALGNNFHLSAILDTSAISKLVV